MIKQLLSLSFNDRLIIFDSWHQIELDEPVTNSGNAIVNGIARDLYMWLDESLEGDCCYYIARSCKNQIIYQTFYFINEEDLMLFKLAWL